MLNKIHEILRDKDCTGNIRCFTWAFVCVMVYLSVFLYGFGVLGLSYDVDDLIVRQNEKTNVKINKLLIIDQEILNLIKDHRHKMFSGRVFTEQNKSNKKP